MNEINSMGEMPPVNPPRDEVKEFFVSLNSRMEKAHQSPVIREVGEIKSVPITAVSWNMESFDIPLYRGPGTDDRIKDNPTSRVTYYYYGTSELPKGGSTFNSGIEEVKSFINYCLENGLNLNSNRVYQDFKKHNKSESE